MLTDEEALEAAVKRSSGLEYLSSVDAYSAGFHAALAWLRSQGEQIGEMSQNERGEWSLHWNRSVPFGAKLFLAPQPAIPDGWQPIESAPKDGARILVFATSEDDPYDRPSTVAEAWWGDEGGSEIAHWMGLGLTDWHRPTHWMPLPAAPEPTIPDGRQPMDAKRLEFVTEGSWYVQWEIRPGKPKRYRMVDDGDAWGKWYLSAREAIDAAMLATTPEPKSC